MTFWPTPSLLGYLFCCYCCCPCISVGYVDALRAPPPGPPPSLWAMLMCCVHRLLARPPLHATSFCTACHVMRPRSAPRSSPPAVLWVRLQVILQRAPLEAPMAVWMFIRKWRPQIGIFMVTRLVLLSSQNMPDAPASHLPRTRQGWPPHKQAVACIPCALYTAATLSITHQRPPATECTAPTSAATSPHVVNDCRPTGNAPTHLCVPA